MVVVLKLEQVSLLYTCIGGGGRAGGSSSLKPDSDLIKTKNNNQVPF